MVNSYCVLYKIMLPHETWEDVPLEAFLCDADDDLHARRQCKDAYPKAFIHKIYMEV